MPIDDMSSEPGQTITDGSRIAGGRGGWLKPITSSDMARELSRKRWDNASQAVRLGVADAGEALPAIGMRSAARVIRYLSKEHTLHASTPGARGAVSSFGMILDRGWPRPEREQGAGASGDGLTIHMDGEIAQRLLERLVGAKAEDDVNTP